MTLHSSSKYSLSLAWNALSVRNSKEGSVFTKTRKKDPVILQCFSNSLFSAFNLCRFISAQTSLVQRALKSVEGKKLAFQSSSWSFSYCDSSCVSSLLSCQRRGQRQHRLQATAQDEGGGHQRPNGQAEVLLHLQDLQAATCLPLQPLRQLRGWVGLILTASLSIPKLLLTFKTMNATAERESSQAWETLTLTCIVGWCQSRVDRGEGQIHFELNSEQAVWAG